MAQDLMAMLQALLGGGGAPPTGGLPPTGAPPMRMAGGPAPAATMADPRAAAISQLPQQGPMQPYRTMPGRDTVGLEGEMLPPYTTPAPDSMARREEAGRSNKTTEQELQDVHDQMDYMAGDDPGTDQDEWPETPEEFKLKYGREPATDSEVEFYYGPDGSDNAQDSNTDGDTADEEAQYNKKRNLRR